METSSNQEANMENQQQPSIEEPKKEETTTVAKSVDIINRKSKKVEIIETEAVKKPEPLFILNG